MAKLGTAYVEVKPDLSAFGAGLGEEIKAKLKAFGSGAVSDLHQKVHVDVDVDRNRIQRAAVGIASDFEQVGASITKDIGTALSGVATAAGGFLGVGSSFTALGSAAAAAAPLIAGLAVALGVLAASFGAAVAGAAALGAALAGALGPVALVAFAALARIAVIIKAIHDDGQQTAASSQAVAAAQDQLRAATEGVANAQSNLKTQTVAAYRAMADAVEAVRADVIGLETAQEGVEQASINLREAQKALKDFKAEAPGLDAVFKKFTDVNVDLSGLKNALAQARKRSGGKLSEDDSLKLEQLILNVRKAKTGEKQATDDLHNSNVKLQRDRQTEADYLKRGIAAYPGYTSAVQGLASAQRQLASAQRASVAAGVKQQGELSKLSPVEQKLAATFKLIADAFDKAFSPALNAVFGGLNRALRIFARVITDPKIVGALKGIGKAIGGVLVNLAKSLASKEFRNSFVTLARGGAQLVKILGNRVFKDILKIFTRIAVAALPALVGLLSDFADTLDRWARWIQKNPKQFRKDIDGLIGSFKGWLGVIIDVGGFLLNLGIKLKNLGDTAGRIFRNIKGGISDALDGSGKLNEHFSALNSQGLPTLTAQPQKPRNVLGFDAKDLAAISESIRRLGIAFHRILDPLKVAFANIFGSVADVFRGFVQIIAGIISRNWSEIWRGFKSIASGAMRFVLGVLQASTAPFRTLTKRLGQLLLGPFRAAKTEIGHIMSDIKNAVIDTLNVIIGLINKIHFKVPGIIPGIGGDNVGIHIDPISTPKKSKPNLNTGRLPALTTQPQVKRTPAPKVAPLGTAHDSATTINNNEINISAPAAAVPDPRHAAALFAREVAKVG